LTGRERLVAAGRFVWTNLDALFVMLAAAVALFLELLGRPDQALIDSVILALLGTTALVLLRDRQSRSRLKDLVAFVEDLRSDRPYEVRSETNRWDIDEGGEFATFTKTQELRFTRNEVCVLEHWCTGTGEVKECHAEWRLDTERSRGDVLQWRVTRKLKNSFPSKREAVSLRLQAPTHSPRMRVVWPRDREPQQIEIRYEDGSPGRRLQSRRDGDERRFVDEQLDVRSTDAVARIEWTW
jgi:hypothetical protein